LYWPTGYWPTGYWFGGFWPAAGGSGPTYDTYYYRIRTTDGQGNYSPYSIEYKVAAIAPPAAPSLTLIGGTPPGLGDFASGSLYAPGLPYLSWAAVAGATSYDVYRGSSSDSLTLLESGIEEEFYVDETADYGTEYWYAVAGANACGAGSQSAAQSITPTPYASAGAGYL
jgi:hypothetical protein